MTRRHEFVTATGRGLVWAQRGEVLLGVVAVLYLVTRNPAIAVGGFFLAGIPGIVSARRMWVGKEEFGPVHEKAARRGTYLFVIAALLFLLAYASSGTFTSATQTFDPAQNETVSNDSAHRFQDLLPSLVLVCLALILETASGAHFLWELVGSGWRRFAASYALLGAACAAIAFSRGLAWVNEKRDLLGDRVDSVPAARYYFEDWVETVLPLLMASFLLTRGAAVVLLRRAMAKVAEAEAAPTGEPEGGSPRQGP